MDCLAQICGAICGGSGEESSPEPPRRPTANMTNSEIDRAQAYGGGYGSPYKPRVPGALGALGERKNLGAAAWDERANGPVLPGIIMNEDASPAANGKTPKTSFSTGGSYSPHNTDVSPSSFSDRMTEVVEHRPGDVSIQNLMLLKASGQRSFDKRNTQHQLWDKYERDCTVGEGGFASVCKVRCRSTGMQRAVKVMKIDQQNRDLAVAELAILITLDHPNILHIYEWFEEEDKLYFITELCHGGELQDLLVEGAYVEVTDHGGRRSSAQHRGSAARISEDFSLSGPPLPPFLGTGTGR